MNRVCRAVTDKTSVKKCHVLKMINKHDYDAYTTILVYMANIFLRGGGGHNSITRSGGRWGIFEINISD